MEKLKKSMIIIEHISVDKITCIFYMIYVYILKYLSTILFWTCEDQPQKICTLTSQN